jgi:cytochrome c oxidase subunit III
MNRNKTMMLLFVGSEALFFLALIIAYVHYTFQGGKLSPTAKYLDIKDAAIFTAFLLTSSLTIELAASKLHHRQDKGILVWLTITIIFGLVFLAGQITEYVLLVRSDVTVSKNVFGSAFFTLTGFHGLHVLIGLIILTIIWLMIFSGKYKAIETEAFEGAAIYWHFVDAVWIVVFTVIYIGAIVL